VSTVYLKFWTTISRAKVQDAGRVTSLSPMQLSRAWSQCLWFGLS